MNFDKIYWEIRRRKCLTCKGDLPEDYELQYCCSGWECGCYGLPIEPWTCCDACEQLLLQWDIPDYIYMWT